MINPRRLLCFIGVFHKVKMEDNGATCIYCKKFFSAEEIQSGMAYGGIALL